MVSVKRGHSLGAGTVGRNRGAGTVGTRWGLELRGLELWVGTGGAEKAAELHRLSACGSAVAGLWRCVPAVGLASQQCCGRSVAVLLRVSGRSVAVRTCVLCIFFRRNPVNVEKIIKTGKNIF